MLSKFLDPKNDFAFRRVFGTEKNKDILIHFLNTMLTFQEALPIIDVVFLKTIQDPEIAAQKTSLVDILCRDTKGHQYIVEMQVAKEKGFIKRAQYYAAKAYAAQALVGGAYADLKAIIFLAIANFIMFPQKAAYKSEHIILDQQTQEHDLKDFSFTFLELPKFTKRIEDLQHVPEKWMYFLKHAAETSEADLSRLIGSDQILERAYQELNQLSWNEEELRTYEQTAKYAGALQAAMAQKYDDGLATGLVQGIQEGREQGIQEGMQRIALKMLQSGQSAAEIAVLTELPLALIHKLQQKVIKP